VDVKNIKKFKIIVIEDEAVLREFIFESLKDYFSEIIFAENGKEALEIIKIEKPWLVITDITMPTMNGLIMTQKLRSEGNLTPVIFQSASKETAEIVSAIRLGAADFIQKPFTSDELLATVGRIMYTEQKMAELEQLKKENISPEELFRIEKTLGLIKAGSIKKVV
jgi:DNA-binding NtrC family response regulator